MKRLICVPGILDADRAKKLLASVRFSATARDYPSRYRNNDRALVDSDTLARDLQDRLYAFLPRWIERDGERWALVGLNSRFRFCRYDEGQAFCRHRDGPWIVCEDRRSFLTCMVYLDEGFTGGATRFYATKNGECIGSIAPRMGQALIFDHAYWHDGEAVTSGVKHVMRTDVIYQRVSAPASRSKDVLCDGLGYVWRLRVSARGTLLAGVRSGEVIEIDASSGERIGAFRAHEGSVMALCELADGSLLSAGRDKHVVVTRGGTSSRVASLEGTALDACVLHDGRAVVCDASGALTFIDGERVHRREVTHEWLVGITSGGFTVSESGAIFRIDGTLVSDLALSATSIASCRGTLFIGTSDGRVMRNGREWARCEDAIAEIRVDASGAVTVCSEDGTARVVDAEGRILCLTSHLDFVRSAAWHRGILYSTGYDGTVRRNAC
jgi:2OG-Fe(II) oxygenase superfamily